ncbi:MAG: chemotaxis protein [Sideroxydans sp.]|nr:chemotaxis protein [Sideroxydans sp.]
MKLSSISQRLVLLVAVPLVALTTLAGLLINQAYTTYQNSIQTHQLMSLSVNAGNLIHTLQIERGATVGFLQSKGQKFSDVLPGLRTKTDERVALFVKDVDAIDLSQMPKLADAISKVKDTVNNVAGIRQRASDLSLTVPEGVAYYSGGITQLIDVMSGGVALNRDASISQQMIAYLSFVRAKENAGQERALATAAFAANKMEPAQYRAILTKINHQEAYLNDFRSIANSESKASLVAVLESSAAKEVATYRDTLISKSAEGDFGVEPTQWFKTITTKIDGLHATEELITNQINSDAAVLQQSSRIQLIAVLLGGLVAILLTVAVSYWVAKSIATPLNEMVSFTERAIVNNDFSGKVPEHGASEVIRTGKALNQLIDKFRKIILDTKKSSEQITVAAHALAVSSNEVKENSIVQSSAAESVAAAVEESSVSISETSNSAQAAAELVTNARADSENAGKIMQETVFKMNDVAKLIRASGDSVHHLDESSQKIGHIVQVIKEIADQTNLLALNAAIEAARAGEQGRGFAVVADEVRKLAERTGLATGEIGALIKAIQDDIGGTVVSMQQANLNAASSLELVNKSANALQKIDKDDIEVSNDVMSISNALAEQDAAIRQIAVNIEQIAQMTESNNNASTANNTTASELDGLALQLRNSVAVYKV